jgi:molybdopterin biosynthesis enzyme MoaB
MLTFPISRWLSTAKIDKSRPFLPVNIAVLTVSDTWIEADDKSGSVKARASS